MAAPAVPTADRDALDAMRAPVADVMTHDVLCVPQSVSVDALEELLVDSELTGMPVIDDERRLVGYVALTDVVRERRDEREREATQEIRPARTLARASRPPWGYQIDLAPRTVADVMSPVALELAATCPIGEAISALTEHALDRAPVVDLDGHLIGVVSAGDIVHFLARGAGGGALRTRLAEAERLVALEFLASGVAHQINDALTASRLSLGRLRSFELARRSDEPEELHRLELIQDIREGVARIERVARELAAFAHDDDGPARTLSVVGALEGALALVAHQLRHRAQIVCDYAAAPAVHARPGELRRVLVNVLVNAAQAIPDAITPAQGHHEIRIATRTHPDTGDAVIEIRDTGTGISRDVLARVFEPFFSTRRDGRGLGIGLAVARDVVAAIGGQIAIDSEVGEGTTVRITLPPSAEATTSRAPVVPAAEAARPAPAIPSTIPALAPRPRERPRRILVIDDDRAVAVAIACELAEHDVVVAESGCEALEILRKDAQFDLVLCDLMMPGVSGIDVYESIRRVEPHLQHRVVLTTGGAFTPQARAFLTSTDVPVLEKPFRSEQLQRVVAAVRH